MTDTHFSIRDSKKFNRLIIEATNEWFAGKKIIDLINCFPLKVIESKGHGKIQWLLVEEQSAFERRIYFVACVGKVSRGKYKMVVLFEEEIQKFLNVYQPINETSFKYSCPKRFLNMTPIKSKSWRKNFKLLQDEKKEGFTSLSLSLLPGDLVNIAVSHYRLEKNNSKIYSQLLVRFLMKNSGGPPNLKCYIVLQIIEKCRLNGAIKELMVGDNIYITPKNYKLLRPHFETLNQRLQKRTVSNVAENPPNSGNLIKLENLLDATVRRDFESLNRPPID